MLKKISLLSTMMFLLFVGFSQLALAFPDECHMSCQQEANQCIRTCRQIHFDPDSRGECWYECRVLHGICNQECP